jgi:hypothetical protein
VSAEQAEALRLPAQALGDAHTRLLAAVDVLDRQLASESGAQGAHTAPAPPARELVPVGALGALVEGCDLAVARLVVASLGPWLLPVGTAAHA